MSRRPDAAPPASVRLAEIDELEVSIDKLVAGGEGIARLDGIPIFVPRAAPGDRLRVRLTERKPDYARAEIVEGTPLVLLDAPGGFVLMTRQQLRTRVRDELDGLDLVSELLAERRAASRREDGE